MAWKLNTKIPQKNEKVVITYKTNELYKDDMSVGMFISEIHTSDTKTYWLIKVNGSDCYYLKDSIIQWDYVKSVSLQSKIKSKRKDLKLYCWKCKKDVPVYATAYNIRYAEAPVQYIESPIVSAWTDDESFDMDCKYKYCCPECSTIMQEDYEELIYKITDHIKETNKSESE